MSAERQSAENDAPVPAGWTRDQWVEELATAWDKGYQAACDETPMGHAPDGPTDEQNPYRVLPPAKNGEAS